MGRRMIKQRRPRQPAHISPAVLDKAFAPFRRPPARDPRALPRMLIVHEHRIGDLRYNRLELSSADRAKLLKSLGFEGERADDALAWLTDELRLP